jgi:glycosyltransferase involved in cell wall biosynthesis
MNILLVNHYAGSPDYGMEFRPYYLAKEWVRHGHCVFIVCASYSHLRIKQPEIKNSLLIENIDGIKYIWIKTPKYESSLKRVVNILVFVLKLMRLSNEIVKLTRPDWVISSSTYPLDIYPVNRICKKSKAKLCYEVHDIWPLSPMVIGHYSKWHPFIFLMQMAENKACKSCDKLVSLLWNSEAHFKEHGLASGKFSCIPNGYVAEEWAKEKLPMDLPSPHDTVLSKLKRNGNILVGFAGGFAPSGSLMTLLRAAKELQMYNNIYFLFVGKGPEENLLRNFVKNNKLSNVFFLPPVAKRYIPLIDSFFDIAFVGGVHSVLHNYGTSSVKLTDYMLSSKPIIQAMDEPGSIIEKLQCGIRVEAENYKSVANAILRFSKLTSKERQIIGEKGRIYAENNLEYSILAKKFIEVLET